MNDVLMKGALKMIKNFISPEQIKEAAKSMIKSAIDFQSKIPLNEGETEATAIFFQRDGIIYFSIAFLNDSDCIIRQENIQPLDTLIDQLIHKL